MKRKALVSFALVAMFILFTMSPRAQETMGGAGKGISPDSSAAPSQTNSESSDLLRMVRRLARLRKSGDIEGAARLFAELFPSEPAVDSVKALKTDSAPLAGGIGGASEAGKAVLTAEGTYPVFATPEYDKHPSADVGISADGAGTYYSAAEQWTGDRPGYIRVRRSTDGGLSWFQSLVLGDGRAVTHPALRLVADDTIGVAFVKEWDGADSDIYFARVDAAMRSVAEAPVALSLSGQSAPSIASDREAFSAPYVYIAYAEREGSAGSIKFRVSQDLGASWSRAATIAAFPWPAGIDVGTALAFDPDEDALHLVYNRVQGGAAGIAVMTSRNFGISWSAPVQLTKSADGTVSGPAIAARAGTVVVAYEHERPGQAPDVGMAHSSDSGTSWTRGAVLAASAAAERSPDVRSLAGPGPAAFFASYVEANDKVVIQRATAGVPGSWVTELTYPESGGLPALGSAIVLPMPGLDGEGTAGVLWTDTSADDDIFFSASARILAPGPITVTPADALVSSGFQGGPFTPASLIYTVTNTGDEAISYHFTKTQAWTSVDPAAVGTLAAFTAITCTVSINEGANIAAPGNYNDTVTFANLTNGTGNTTRQVTLNVLASPGALTVTPAGGLTASGIVGGSISPSSQVYVLQNSGGTAINWTCSNTQAWTTLSATSGTLAGGGSFILTVSINSAANALPAGTYTDTVTFTNTTNGTGNTTRPVSLTLTSPGVLAVTPAGGLTSAGPTGGPFTPSSQAYTLQNTGGVAINWTCANFQTWTTLSATSGTLAPGATTTVTVSINTAANALAVGSYTDLVTFTNTTNGAGNATRSVSLTVSAPGTLVVTPAGGLVSAGLVGGPFTPSSQAYTLQNTGGISINWTCTRLQAWTTVSLASGTLAAGATATVTVSLNTAANALAAGAYADTVTFTNTTNGSGNTTRPVSLTVSTGGVLAVTPAGGLTSAGPVGGPFSPTSQTYTLQNTGGSSINWTAAKTQAWTSLYQLSGTLAPGASTTVDILINTTANTLAAGAYADTLTITNTTNGVGTTTRPVNLTVSTAGVLTVTPAGGLTSTGIVGGPFTPASLAYTLTNTGGQSINWTCAHGQTWTTVSLASGTLAAGATATVTVSINTTANTLAAGSYADTVIFTNTTNGSGNTTRPVALTVSTPGALVVTPAGGLTSTGIVGGPFTPSSQAFTLQNTGGVSINWTCTRLQAWTTVSLASGTLAAGATATVTVSINTTANTLAAGAYADTVTFTNTTNGSGTTTRPVALTVSAPGALVVTPTGGLASVGPVGGPFTPSSQAYTLTNTGGVSINWTCADVQAWADVSLASGTLAAGGTATVTVTINATANTLAVGAYTDTVTFTNTTNGSGNTTRPVTLTVSTVGVLAVTPATGLVSSGVEGGPFTPSSQVYTLQNTGGSAINWTCANGQAWTLVSATSGALAAGATTTVTVSLNTTVTTFSGGVYTGSVAFTNATNGNGNTTRSVTLTVLERGSLTIEPTGTFASAGPVGGPFTPPSQSYTLTNMGEAPIAWTATKLRAWTTVSPASGTLAARTTVTVTVTINTAANTLAVGSYTDTVTFTNTTNGLGNTTRPVALTVTTAGVLSVTPTGALVSTGIVGGPFTPSSQVYTLTNTGGSAINWTAAKTQAWTSLYLLSGTLAPGASVAVDFLINNQANALPAGTHTDTLTFTNTTNGLGNTTRTVTLTVATAGALTVTPTSGLTSSGLTGGPFTPSSQAYTLRNTGGTAINWAGTKLQGWTTVSPSSGTLAAGASVTATVSINSGANALIAGTHNDTISFTNTTNGSGNTARAVTLTIALGPDLFVEPTSRQVSFAAGTATFAVGNVGGGTLNWTAAVVSGGEWLSIVSGSSGTGTGTITVAYAESASTSPRIGTIRVTATGAVHSPQDLTITQGTSSIVLGLTAERLVERAWIIQREYGRLTVTVNNPGSFPVASYVISRTAAGGNPTAVGEVAGSSVTSPWSYNDTFLQTGTSYTYRILALDALGNVVGASNTITI